MNAASISLKKEIGVQVKRRKRENCLTGAWVRHDRRKSPGDEPREYCMPMWTFVCSHHRATICQVNRVGSDRGLGALLRIPPIDLEVLDTLALRASTHERKNDQEKKNHFLETRQGGQGSGAGMGTRMHQTDRSRSATVLCRYL